MVVYVKCSIPDAGWDGPFHSSKFSEAVIEEGVDSIGSYAFNGCSFLERLTLPSTLRKISNDAFRDCSGFTELTLPSGIERIAKMRHTVADHQARYLRITENTVIRVR